MVRAATYRLAAIGGVSRPISMLVTRMMAKCTGSIPNLAAAGANSGPISSVAALVSMNMPISSNTRFTTSRNTIALSVKLVGFGIGTIILVVAWNSGRELWYRLMDATDPEVTRLVGQTAAEIAGVLAVEHIRIRWLGHWQQAELHITVAAQLLTLESHQIAEIVRHALFHALPSLQEVTVHVDPLEQQVGSAHELTAHHTPST